MMYGLTTIKGLIKRERLAAFALAALISLAAVSSPAQAQRGASGPDIQFQGGIFVGVASGQTVRLRIAATNNRGKLIVGVDDVIVGAGVSVHVKVFDSSTGALLQSRALTSLTAGLHLIDIKRGDLPGAGAPGTGRIQLWIKVLIVSRPAVRVRAAEHGVSVLPPTWELMDDESGRTTVSGGLWKTTNFLTAH